MPIKKKRVIFTMAFMLILIPVLLFCGVYLGDRNYRIVSMLVLILACVPFFMMYEKKRPQLREMVTLAVMCALAVAGRAAFYFLPQFKPILAIIIITAIAFGPEAGFLCGALSMLLSNFLFGQGPWTPWQMFGCGLIGLIAGFLAFLPWFQKKWALCAYGIVSGYIYGIFVDMWSVIGFTQEVTKKSIIAVYAAGFPFNTILAVATAIFLFFLAHPILEKLTRIKVKYGLIEHVRSAD